MMPRLMALMTKGFVNARELNRHFSEHGPDFGASNATDYEHRADVFLGGQHSSGVHECTRRKGDIIRYDPQTEAYGVVDKDGVIRTFFKPVPCSKVPASVRAAVKMSGRCHGHQNNLVYFQAECRKW
jgi:hypothetical protein